MKESLPQPPGVMHLPLSPAKALVALEIMHILERCNFIIFFYGPWPSLKKRWRLAKFLFMSELVFANTGRVEFMEVEAI